MSIQFDGTGRIDIPEAVATGDFSIIFEGVLITNPASWGMIAGHTASSHFIGINNPSTVTARVNGDQFQGLSKTIGDTVKVEVRRIGLVKYLLFDDVEMENKSSTGDFKLDKFGAYTTNAYNYTGVLSGTITMTGFTGGVRTYTTDGTAGDTTLVDTTSAQDGTFTGFVTGGFVTSESESDALGSAFSVGFDSSTWGFGLGFKVVADNTPVASNNYNFQNNENVTFENGTNYELN